MLYLMSVSYTHLSSQAAKEAISPLTPGNVQSKMASVMKGKSIENAKAFENIPDVYKRQ